MTVTVDLKLFTIVFLPEIQMAVVIAHNTGFCESVSFNDLEEAIAMKLEG